MHLSSSAEKTPRRVRTSLEEKYAKLSKTATAESPASAIRIKEEQDTSEQQNTVITVVCGLFWYYRLCKSFNCFGLSQMDLIPFNIMYSMWFLVRNFSKPMNLFAR